LGGLKPGFSGGLGPLPAPPVKFPRGLSPSKPPVICTHGDTTTCIINSIIYIDNSSLMEQLKMEIIKV